MRGTVLLAALTLAVVPVTAQQSTSFDISQSTFNAGGHPSNGTTMSSASFEISLDSIGDTVATAEVSGPSFTVGGGFGAAFPAPGEVQGLLFLGQDALSWSAEPAAGVYQLYRGRISDVDSGAPADCTQQELTGLGTTDADPVPADDGFLYLVTVVNRLGEEGTKGFASAGGERSNPLPCP